MPQLYGRDWTPDELRRRVGDLSQLGGVTRTLLDDGAGRGSRVALVRTGGGLEAEVLLDRAMDLGRVNFKGAALGFRAPCGDVHPSFYETQGVGWLRSFSGLLATCGLQNVGGPCEDEGMAHGVHGRINNTPAERVAVSEGWDGDAYRIAVSGRMREVTPLGLFGPNLTLTRTLRTELGANWLRIDDVVENEGFTDAALLILYHVNVGFPVLDDGARLLAKAKKTEPRDEAARPGLGAWDRFEKPQAGYAEQVFFHDLVPGADGRAKAAIVSPERAGKRLAFCLDYDPSTLPRFIEWKQMGAGPYTVGLEPANCLVLGRAAERKDRGLTLLKPGERRAFSLRLSVLEDSAAIGALEDELRR
ncbi:MAG: aldose 1-epimerase family protein [Planctomycetota bacterium]|nr:aldose 1-epimerase family protein [Planctomycetota bacterium]